MKNQNIIPVLTTDAGRCLTTQNWQEVGVQQVSFHLASLLVKPGLAYLKTLPDWSMYSGWAGDWVLNASMTAPNSEGQYVFCSPYDGAKITCSMIDIVDILLHLKPQRVVLPEGFQVAHQELWSKLSETMKLLVPIQDYHHNLQLPIHGIYYGSKQAPDLVGVIAKHQAEYPELECYISSESVIPSIDTSMSSLFVEIDYPAQDACSGIVYCREGSIDLQDKVYSMQFESIDPGCHCPTCKQQLTRAYLHHLLEHTPLLCHRFLIQHNIYYRI